MEVSTVYGSIYFKNPLQRDSTRNSMFVPQTVWVIVVLVEISRRKIMLLTMSHNVKDMRSMLVSLESCPYMGSVLACIPTQYVVIS